MINSWYSWIVAILVIAGTQTIVAQTPSDISPFSRLGLGDFYFQNTVNTLGMGGFGAAYISSNHVNLANPASLGYLRTAALESSVFFERSELDDGVNVVNANNGNMGYISIAFPLQNVSNQIFERKESKFRWGMNFALLPYTNVAYDSRFTNTGVLNDSLTTRTELSGSGGTSKVLWRNGVKYRNLSVGVSMGVLFGNIENRRRVDFVNLPNSYDDFFASQININGFVYDIGAMYAFNFDPLDDQPGKETRYKQSITVGISGNAGTRFSTEANQIWARQLTNTSGLDTIRSNTNLKERGRLPAEVTLGLTYRYGNKITAGLDLTYSDWGNFEFPADDTQRNRTLSAGTSLRGGVQWIPDANSYNRYLKRVSYRVGGYFIDDPRLNDLQTTALTAGIGFPIRLANNRTSFVDIAFEYGNQVSDTIDEQFWRIHLGFVLNDNSWFFKRKFN